jgi:DNA-binding XRE family transcriptional regulator
MPRPRNAPTTALGASLVGRRAAASLEVAAAQVGLPYTTLSRLERGTHRPSLDTAVKLARWLGWSVEQVVEAAGQPAPEGEGQE